MDQGTPEHDPTADLLDVDGRPVGEVGSRRYDGRSTTIVACPYADARRGGPMNQTALRQLSSCWSEVLAAAATLVGTDPTVHRAWRACIAGTRAPAVHHDRHGGPVPRGLSALYKSSLGFSQVLTALLLAADRMADRRLAELGDADAFFALLDRERWLVGAVQVCAGPAPMIGQMFDALAGRGAAEASSPDFAVLREGLRAGWVDQRVQWIAVQVAFLGAIPELGARAGGIPPEASDHLSPAVACLRSVLAVPGRLAAHARRLFEREEAPPCVARFLHAAAGSSTLPELLRARQAALDTIGSDQGGGP